VHEHEIPGAEPRWTWTVDANAFFGYNHQQRRYLDYTAWESQNWFMASGDRELGTNRLSIAAMISLEPVTLADQGSPQLFQTGESYRQTPLVNYQHPHDLLMGLGATYRIVRGGAAFFAGADVVGSATLGPTPFMHRESARDNPQVPLTHHFLDSTHITQGVVRAGASAGPMTVESSLFRGREPDENRLDLEPPQLDSWAARVRWDAGAWHAQVSGGHLRQPEWWEPYDTTRLTASLAFDGIVRSVPLRVTLAWGGNREFNGFNGNADGYLMEWSVRAGAATTLYGRAEVADKELFGLGFHPRGQAHPHTFHRIGAVSVGYLREVATGVLGRVGVGGDATFYRMPEPLRIYWDSSRSFHFFVRWRPSTAATHIH
jgi:hypothetical protein